MEPPRSRQSAGDVLERAGLTWREGLTLYLAQERPNTVQGKGIPDKQRNDKCGPVAVVQNICGLDSAHSSPVAPSQARAPGTGLCYAGKARVKPSAPHSMLLSLGGSHSSRTVSCTQNWVSLQYPKTFSSCCLPLPTSPSRKPLGEAGLFQGIVA